MSDEMKSARRLPLPAHAYEDLVLVVKNADKLEAFSACFAEAEVSRDLKKVGAAAAEKTGVSEKDANSIVASLLILHRVREDLGWGIDAFISSFGAFLQTHAKEKWEDELKSEWESKHAFMQIAFADNSPLALLDKALDLAYSHQSILQEMRLVTDVRPVFNTDASEIVRMVIIHQLEIVYSDGSTTKKMYLAVDARDIIDIEKQCERAKRKATLLSDGLTGKEWSVSVIGEHDER